MNRKSWNEPADLLERDYAEAALVQAAIEACDAEVRVERTQFYTSALRGRPEVRNEVGHHIELRYLDHFYAFTVHRTGMKDYHLSVDGSDFHAHVERLQGSEASLSFAGLQFRIAVSLQESNYRVEVNDSPHVISLDNGWIVRAPSPAVVTCVTVKPGDIVSRGDRLGALEAMKTEMDFVAPFSGIVRRVMVIPNVQVCPGTPLVQIDACIVPADPSLTERLQFPAEPTTNRSVCEHLERLRQMMLGFEEQPDLSPASHPASSEEKVVCGMQDDILNIFVDICSLFRRTPTLRSGQTDEAPSTEAYLYSYLHRLDAFGESLPSEFVNALQRAVSHYGLQSLERSTELEDILLWICKSHQRMGQQVPHILTILKDRLSSPDRHSPDESSRALLDRMISITRDTYPLVGDLARELRYRYFDHPMYECERNKILASIEAHLDYFVANPEAPDVARRKSSLIDCPQNMAYLFSRRIAEAPPGLQHLMLEVLTSRYYCISSLTDFRALNLEGYCSVSTSYEENGTRINVFALHADRAHIAEALSALFPVLEKIPAQEEVVLDLLVWQHPAGPAADILQQLVNAQFSRTVQRVAFAVPAPDPAQQQMQYYTYEPSDNGFDEVQLFRGVHPMTGERLHLWRLRDFKLTRQPTVEDVYLLHAVANANPNDERLFAVAEVRDLTPIRDTHGVIVRLPCLERKFSEAVAAIRVVQSQRPERKRLYWNRIFLYIWPALDLSPTEVDAFVHRLAPSTAGLGLEQVVVRARIPNSRTGELRDTIVRISAPGDAGVHITFRPAAKLQPLKPLAAYEQKVVKMRQRGLLYPYEIVKLLTPAPEETRADFPPGVFGEYDLDSAAQLIPVLRPYGQNTANVIVGVIQNFTHRYPEGMSRVMLLGDPSRDLGAIAEPECRRIIAALDLAENMSVPLEWFPVSAGAKISMESGVENMDWIARVLKRLIEFTQAGGEINIVVNGINVGAQPYWNAEATMLMHTRGILIMTPKGAMVLTGKRALDYSGSVSAEDNHGIGGYDRIMGVNGQAQYFARTIDEACHILMRHYEHAYVAPGERFPRRALTIDPVDRDIRPYPLADPQNGFARVGDIFSDSTNPGRKHPFDIRNVMRAITDQDHSPLERFSGMRAAESVVVWDAHLGGFPVCVIGIESKPIARFGFVPADGPDQWTAGTLFPMSSKKVARALTSASNNRPVVILANLSGFDGSPESMRRLQLEYGAEIGRAVVNFKGPMIFCVINRYHGGAYVVFSRALNPDIEVAALEGTYASVIGGAPAAAVVFAGEVEARTRKDERLQLLDAAIARSSGVDKPQLLAEWNDLFRQIYSEKLGEVASEFDRIHSVHRALEVGALDRILPASELRPYLIDAVERGIRKHDLERTSASEVKPYARAEPILA